MSSTTKLVTLGDATLTRPDLALLVPPSWFNDSLISFWLEHLRLHIIHHTSNTSKIAILPPNVSFFLALCQDENDAKQLLVNLNLDRKQLFLVTVNDSSVRDFTHTKGPSGSHWSLLVFENCSQSQNFYYLDSMPSRSNRKVATALVDKLRKMLQLPGQGYVDLDVPMQENMYDCGAYLCIFAQHVICNYQNHHSVADLYKYTSPPTSRDVENIRHQIGKLASRLFDHHHPDTT